MSEDDIPEALERVIKACRDAQKALAEGHNSDAMKNLNYAATAITRAQFHMGGILGNG